jgi:hypothetical protein
MSAVDPRHLLARALLVGAVLLLAGQVPRADTLQTAEARLQADLEVLKVFRPSYPFWQHVFSIPDGRIAFGSARDGRLIATFPTKGDWSTGATWADVSLGTTVTDVKWPLKLDARRDLVVQRLEPTTGPLLSNPTRGQFLLPNIPQYGGFLSEWGLIYERFGVPADIGLAQAVLESGRVPTHSASASGSAATGRCSIACRR